MTERKVLNKYFPPDFDPSKIPRLRGKKKEKIFSIRTMAPFNMLCLTCRNYIFKAKKFNSRMEESGDLYLGLKEYRFHIRCPTCCAEIIYKTDRENNDYVVETGAKRSFEAYTTAIRQAIREEAAEKEELDKNPLRALEKRTEDSAKEFKEKNNLQNLLDKSKRSKSREETIEKTLAILHQENKLKEAASAEELAILEEKYLQRKLLESQSTSKNVEIDKSDEIDLMLKETRQKRFSNIKQKLANKRKASDTEGESSSKVIIFDAEKFKETEENPTVNIFGIDYDSD